MLQSHSWPPPANGRVCRYVISWVHPIDRSQHDRCVLARLPHSLCEVLHIRRNAAPCTRASWQVLACCWTRGRECRVEIASARDLLAVGEGGRCPNQVKLGRAGDVRCTTALPPKAVHLRSCYVAFVPIGDICSAAKRALLFDHLVGAGEQCWRHCDAK